MNFFIARALSLSRSRVVPAGGGPLMLNKHSLWYELPPEREKLLLCCCVADCVNFCVRILRETLGIHGQHLICMYIVHVYKGLTHSMKTLTTKQEASKSV